MKKQIVNTFQLFTLIFLFELGTAVVVGVGMTAKQDAWWIILLSTGIGIILYLMYTAIFRGNNNIPLTKYIPQILGPLIGYPLSILYILFFIDIAARDVRDLVELIIISIMPFSFNLVIGAVIVLLVAYAVYGGIEPLARAGEIFFFIILIIGIFGTLFIIITPEAINIDRFLPLFQIKRKDLLNTLPTTITVPFGEGTVFMMLFHHLKESKSIRKAGVMAIILAGLSLSLATILEIATLGPYIASTSEFPLLSLTQQINVLNFLQRLDAIAICVMIICVFFKITIFFYAAVTGVTDMFKIKKTGYVIGIISLIVLVYSLLMAKNTVQHLYIGLKIFPLYIHTPMLIIIPLLLLIVSRIRKKKQTMS
ncbi:GerAB/ArcD/ProY family transporter [Neobacillus sp. NRS-1170]|uniref:GerAB/ArcD/ProY family transporter n=1 Tax=Neobacillus sp. NRS-1170 TaxID=3233898 RepID=UPI003D2A8D2D